MTLKRSLEPTLTRVAPCVRRPRPPRLPQANHRSLLQVHLDNGEVLDADCVLSAVGRVPNSKGLGLEALGIHLDAHGAIPVNEWSQTTVPNIYAVGDVTNRVNLTPMAIRLGEYYLAVKQPDEAIEAYQRALTAFPNDMNALLGLKASYEKAKLPKEATETDRKIQDLRAQ